MHAELWPAIVAMALATYLSRALVLALLPGIKLPGWSLRVMRFIPIGVLAALVESQLLAAPARQAPMPAVPELLAAAATAVTAFRTRSILLSLLVGVSTVAILRQLAG